MSLNASVKRPPSPDDSVRVLAPGRRKRDTPKPSNLRFELIDTLTPVFGNPRFTKEFSGTISSFARKQDEDLPPQNYEIEYTWRTHGFEPGHPDIFSLKVSPLDPAKPLQLGSPRNPFVSVRPQVKWASSNSTSFGPIFKMSALKSKKKFQLTGGSKTYDTPTVLDPNDRRGLQVAINRNDNVQELQFEITLEENAMENYGRQMFKATMWVGFGNSEKKAVTLCDLQANFEDNWRRLGMKLFPGGLIKFNAKLIENSMQGSAVKFHFDIDINVEEQHRRKIDKQPAVGISFQTVLYKDESVGPRILMGKYGEDRAVEYLTGAMQNLGHEGREPSFDGFDGRWKIGFLETNQQGTDYYGMVFKLLVTVTFTYNSIVDPDMTRIFEIPDLFFPVIHFTQLTFWFLLPSELCGKNAAYSSLETSTGVDTSLGLHRRRKLGSSQVQVLPQGSLHRSFLNDVIGFTKFLVFFFVVLVSLLRSDEKWTLVLELFISRSNKPFRTLSVALTGLF
ncbi:hypothetical protein T439DRAFT_363656 [Meredithblackwellia eburnea MCA 4105]